MASLNVAETLVPALIDIDQLPGETDTTAGRVTSVWAKEKPKDTIASNNERNFLLVRKVDLCAITIFMV